MNRVFEQRFDHICADHAVAMAAIEQRVREVVARRHDEDSAGDGTDGTDSTDGTDGTDGAACDDTTVDGESEGEEEAAATRSVAVIAARSGDAPVPSPSGITAPSGCGQPQADARPPAGARWPEREQSMEPRAGLFDPRWNSDLS